MPDELLAHTSPLTWEHIGFSGNFLWDRAPPSPADNLLLGMPKMGIGYGYLGLFILVVSIGLRFWRRRAAFYRQNQTGVQEFRSYRYALFNRMLDRVVNIVSLLGILVAVGLILTTRHHR